MAQQIKVNVNFNDLPNVKCECGSMTFKEVYMIKKVSGLVTGSGKTELMPYPQFMCTECGEILDNAKEEKEEKKSSIIVP